MRISVTAMLAASVVAAGFSMEAAQALPRTPAAASPCAAQAAQHKQRGEDGNTQRRDSQRGHRHPGRGFVGTCQWLRARALTSHNPVWWRKYRQCIAAERVAER